MSNDIVSISVSITQSAPPDNQQQQGYIISQGGTTLTAGQTRSIAAQADLTAILGVGAAATELQAMYTTYGLNNAAKVAPTVLELGTAGTRASGTITFTANPSYGVQANNTITIGAGNASNGNTVVINGTTVTFVTGTPVGNQVLIGTLNTDTAANLQAFLQSSADANIALSTYSTTLGVTTMTAKVFGTAGNAYTLTKVGANITIGGATFANGVDADTVTVNGTAITFVNAGATGNHVVVGTTKEVTAASLLSLLSLSTDTNIAKMTYSLSGAIITATSKIAGTGGNAYTLADTSTAITTTANLSGGGSNSVAGGVADLASYISNHPKTVYAVLCPDEWENEATFKTLMQNNSTQGSEIYFHFHTHGDAVFTGTIAATTLTVTDLTYGHISRGAFPTGAGVTSGTYIVGQLTGETGKEGTYQVSASQTVSAEPMTVANTFDTYKGIKSACYYVKSPVDAATVFPAAGTFALQIGTIPTETNKVADFSFRYIYGSDAYNWSQSEQAQFKAAYANFTATAAEGGLPLVKLLKWGTLGDGMDIKYWYAIDWAQINLQRDIALDIINGSNRPTNPLLYNQAGINELQDIAQATLNRGVNYALFLSDVGTPLVSAIPFVTYKAANPGDYTAGIYNGMSAVATTQNGFKAITFALNIVNL